MNFDPNNFLSGIKQTTTGSNLGQADDGGFLRDIDVTSQFGVNTTTAVTVSTVGSFTTTLTPGQSTASLVSTGASTFGPFMIPRDYDQTSDQLQFRFLGSTAGALNTQSTVTVLGSISFYSTGTITAHTSAVATAATVFNNSTWNSFGIAFNSTGLGYTDCFTVTLSTSGGNVQLAGASLVFSSCLVAWLDMTPTNIVATESIGASTQLLRTA